jgi:hypothetical protein
MLSKKCHNLLPEDCHGGITITSAVEEMPLPNCRRPSHGGITIISGTKQTEVSDHGSISVTMCRENVTTKCRFNQCVNHSFHRSHHQTER